MKKILAVCLVFVMAFGLNVFAADENSDLYSQDAYCVSTPDDEPVPYPPEAPDDWIDDIDGEINALPNSISLEEAEANKIWEDYGYTKEEFDKFPDALKNAMLYEPEEIGKSFGVPTREDLARWNEKEKIVEEQGTQSMRQVQMK